MAANARNVLIGKGDKVAGTVLRGNAGAAMPTDAQTRWGAGIDHGFIGEDGISLSIEESTETIKDMNGDVARTVTSEHVVTITVPFLEVNEQSLKSTFGDSNVEITSDAAGTLTKVRINSDKSGPSSWVINIKDGEEYLRISVALGTVSTSGEIKLNGSEAILLPITINPMPDANGDKCVIWRFSPKSGAAAQMSPQEVNARFASDDDA